MRSRTFSEIELACISFHDNFGSAQRTELVVLALHDNHTLDAYHMSAPALESVLAQLRCGQLTSLGLAAIRVSDILGKYGH